MQEGWTSKGYSWWRGRYLQKPNEAGLPGHRRPSGALHLHLLPGSPLTLEVDGSQPLDDSVRRVTNILKRHLALHIHIRVVSTLHCSVHAIVNLPIRDHPAQAIATCIPLSA